MVEEAHMRNRQLIARWTFEKGAADKVVEMVKKDGTKVGKIGSANQKIMYLISLHLILILI